jgi:hypothetical protein
MLDLIERRWLLVAIVAGTAAACALTYVTSLIWPPPHPFWF